LNTCSKRRIAKLIGGWMPIGHSLRGRSPSRIVLCILMITAASSIGCGQKDGDAVEMPPVDPIAAARKAIELYDKSGDGSLDETELAASPGMFAARVRYDADANHVITEDEIAAHLTAIYDSGAPWVSVVCQVYRNERPLRGATVRFVPEPFLKDALHPASGTTDDEGRTIPTVVDEVLPADKRGLRIIRPGPYRVEFDHPSVTGTAALRGCEIDPTSRGGTQLLFRL
jgi:hypothetical protein